MASLVSKSWGKVLPLLLFACPKAPEIPIQVILPKDVAAEVQFLELGAFKGVSCSTIRPLAEKGIPEGAAARLAWSVTAPAPGIGTLPHEKYAFVALGKSERCAVVALGCVDIDLADVDTLSVATSALPEPQGACKSETVCALGRCLPSGEPGGCSLSLVGSGPLSPKLGSTGVGPTSISVAATSPGVGVVGDKFVVGYTEMASASALDSVLWATTQTLQSNGAANPADPQQLLEHCGDAPQTDAVGLFGRNDDGLFVLARNPCAGDAGAAGLSGLDVRRVDSLGRGVPGGYSVLGQDLPRVALSHAKSIAQGVSATNFLIAATLPTGATLFRIEKPETGPPVFGRPARIDIPGAATESWVASSGDLVSFLTLSPAGELGSYAWTLGQAPTSPETVGDARTRISGVTWASPLVDGTRVWVATGDAGGTRLRSFEGVALGNAQTVDVNPLATSLHGDIARLSYPQTEQAEALTRIAVATAEAGDVAIRVFDTVGANASLRSAVSLSSLGHIVQKPVRDGQVTIAAAGDRIAVVWVTARTLAKDDPLGGYAILSCTR